MNVVYRRYTDYRFIPDPAAGIPTGLTIKEAIILRPQVRAQRRITQNTRMGIVRSTIINNASVASEAIRGRPRSSEAARGRFCQIKRMS